MTAGRRGVEGGGVGGEPGPEGGVGDAGGWFLKSFEVVQHLESVTQGRH